MTPTVQGETLVYRQDGQEQVLTVDTEAWFAWLETASTFSFRSSEGRFTARREQAGHNQNRSPPCPPERVHSNYPLTRALTTGTNHAA